MADDDSPGWNAIEAAFDRLYPGQTAYHIGYNPGLNLGSALQGCSGYDAADHWHYVTFGLTELWMKDEDLDPAVSGWGYELTMRVSKAGEEVPPQWPFRLLHKVAAVTQFDGTKFEVGHRLDSGGPITGEASCSLTAIAFSVDNRLWPVEGPNGRFEFRHLIGVTAEDLASMKAMGTDVVLDRIMEANPLLITVVR